MCVKCKACGNDMDMVEIPGTTELEFLCDGCKKAANAAMDVDSWDFEGLYWESSLAYIENEEIFHAHIKT